LLRLSLQLLESGVGDGAVKSPVDAGRLVEDQDVGVVGRGKTGGLLEFLFVVIDQEEMGALVFRNAALDAVRGHAANQARHVFQDGDGVEGEPGADAPGPRLGLVLRSVRESQDENGGMAIREFHLLVEQVLPFDGGELLRQQRQGQQKNEQPHGAHPGIT
jgi:hypothetical protein